MGWLVEPKEKLKSKELQGFVVRSMFQNQSGFYQFSYMGTNRIYFFLSFYHSFQESNLRKEHPIGSCIYL